MLYCLTRFNTRARQTRSVILLKQIGEGGQLSPLKFGAGSEIAYGAYVGQVLE